MDTLFDILLNKPLPDSVIHTLLFFLFVLHLVFVLFTVGTAILAVFYFIQTRWRGDKERLFWGKRILETFLTHKSLAVVLGVGPLLLMQVDFTIPFFTATNLLAPFWLSIIGLLIVSFLALDFLGHKWEVRPYLHLAYGLVGLAFLLVVPGIFVAVVVTTESPAYWVEIVQGGYRLPGPLAIHWLARYLHVLGAALVFGGAFHYFYAGPEQVEKRRAMLGWVLAGIFVQGVLGIFLYLSLLDRPNLLTNLFLLIGIGGAGVLGWMVFRRRSLALRPAVVVLALILLPMLLARQTIQDRSLLPFNKAMQENAVAYEQVVAPYAPLGLERYQGHLYTVYDDGLTIYSHSCAFCHGFQPQLGGGYEAQALTIPPEMLTDIHTTRPYLHRQLVDGVNGSAMPYFTFYTRDKLDDLIDFTDGAFRVLSPPEAMPVQVSDSTIREAQQVFGANCTACHGPDGRGQAGQNLAPPPPDFTQFTLSPQRSFDIITNGYPGTTMAAFADLPEDVRWGLVQVVGEFFTPYPAP